MSVDRVTDGQSVLSLLVSVTEFVSVTELGMAVRPEVAFRLVVPLEYVVAVTWVGVDSFEFVVECGTPSTVLLYHLEVTRLVVVC